MDGLRGLAILLVMFYHYVYGGLDESSAAGRWVHAVFPLAWSGVDLFFVLSGFLLGGILLDARESGNYFRTFYIRRCCRILPLYFLWVGLVILLPRIFPQATPSEWYSAVFLREIPHFAHWEYFLFLQNFYVAKTSLFGSSWLAVTWSLAVEEQFYLVLPFAIWVIPRRTLPVVLGALILLVPAGRVLLYLFRPDLFLFVLLPCRADTLLLGVLCACLIKDEKARGWLEAGRERLLLPFIVLLLGVGGLTAFAGRQGYARLFNSFEMVSLGYSWLAMFYASLLLLVVTAKTGLIRAVMLWPWLRHFGIIAYGMFLMHMAVNNLVHGLLFSTASVQFAHFVDLLATLLAFLLTWLLALISWHFLEKPIIAWGHSFSYSKAGGRAAG